MIPFDELASHHYEVKRAHSSKSALNFHKLEDSQETHQNLRSRGSEILQGDMFQRNLHFP